MSFVRAKVTRFCPTETVAFKCISALDPNQKLYSLFPHILETDEKLESFDICCICCGEQLDTNKCLSDYDIDIYTVLQFIVKPKVNLPSTDEFPSRNHQQFVHDFEWLIHPNQEYRISLLWSNPFWFKSLITYVPEIGRDLTAYFLIQDLKMLRAFQKDRENMKKLVTLHPCLAPALRYAVMVLTNKSSYFNLANPLGVDSTINSSIHVEDYSIDQDLNATEGTEEPNDAVDSSLIQSANSEDSYNEQSSHHSISSLQLHAAIAQAQNRMTTLNANFTSSGLLPSSSQRITRDALSRAIASANSVHNPQSETLSTETDVIEECNQPALLPQEVYPWSTQLLQLVEMGFTDETVARQALEATNGNVELAMQFLFN